MSNRSSRRRAGFAAVFAAVGALLLVLLVPTQPAQAADAPNPGPNEAARQLVAWGRAGGLTRLQAIRADLTPLTSQVSRGRCTELAADASAAAATTRRLPRSVGVPLGAGMRQLAEAWPPPARSQARTLPSQPQRTGSVPAPNTIRDTKITHDEADTPELYQRPCVTQITPTRLPASHLHFRAATGVMDL